MKIVTESREVVTGGIGSSKNFSVEVGAHIMAVLSGLYRNPLQAIVREYLTNMYDAYVALGPKYDKKKHPTPVLHLPTIMEPWLEFRDNGIGMDEDTVWNIYSTYGASTKNTNNNEVGGFGLGSKTAFCYENGQAWTIEARKDGKKRVFMASLDEGSLPTLYHADTSDTNEPDGVTIRIPILRDDVSEVVEYANQYVPYFPMELNVTGVPNWETKSFESLVEGTFWKIGKGTQMPYRYGYNYRNGTIKVIMGNVPYELDGSLHTLVESALNARKLKLHGNQLEFTIPVGSVDLVPSRDHLKETDRTLAQIKESVKVMLVEWDNKIQEEKKKRPTQWERLKWSLEMKEAGLYPIEPGQQKVDDYGRRVDNENDFGLSYKIKVSTIKKHDKDVSVVMYTVEHWSGEFTEHGEIEDIDVRYNNFWIIRNDVTNGKKTAQWYLRDKCYRRTRTGRKAKNGHKRGTVVFIKTTLDDTDLSNVLGGIPTDRIENASSYQQVAAKEIRSKGKVNIYKLNSRGTSWEARVRIPDDTEDRYYLPLTKDKYTNRYTYEHMSNLSHVLYRLGQSFPVALYGIRDNEISKITKASTTKWINFETHVITKLNETARKKLDDSSTQFVCWTDLNHATWFEAADELRSLLASLPGSLVKEVVQVKDVLPRYSNTGQHFVSYGIFSVSEDIKEEYEQKKKEMFEKYNGLHDRVKTELPTVWAIVEAHRLADNRIVHSKEWAEVKKALKDTLDM